MEGSASADPKSEKFNHYVSPAILLTADPRVSASGLKILSGDYLRAAIRPESLTASLRSGTNDGTEERFYIDEMALAQSYDYERTYRAELIDSPKPNPANNPSTGLGELAGTVYLHSGEFAITEVDLRIPGRGMDFELRRTYESQSVYSGPLGWNWDLGFNKRLLELPNGDMLYFDGEFRRFYCPFPFDHSGYFWFIIKSLATGTEPAGPSDHPAAAGRDAPGGEAAAVAPDRRPALPPRPGGCLQDRLRRVGNGKLKSHGNGKQESQGYGKQKSHRQGQWDSQGTRTPVRWKETLQEPE